MKVSNKSKNISKKTRKHSKNIKKKIRPSIDIITDKSRLVYTTDGEIHNIPLGQFKADMTDLEIKAFPIINEPMAAFSDTGVFVHPFGVPPPVDYNILWTYFKYSPEIIAVVRAIVEDIMSDGWILEGGRNNRMKAEKFLMENFAKEQITSFLFDALVTGDGYLYVQKLPKNEVKATIDRVLNLPDIKSKLDGEIKHELGDNIFDSITQDEDIFSPRSFIAMPSSTLKAQFDKNGNVLKWIQKVGIRIQSYDPDEIIHFRLLRLDGKFYGFSPMASILKELDILANIKDYARYFFEKGGIPNYLFTMKDESPTSINYKNFKKTLQLFSSLSNKYKSIVVCGDIEAQALNKLDKDMEFRELAKYITGILIMTWGVPVSRLSDTGLGDRIQVRGSTISTEGYYRKISYHQDLLEDMINMKLLAPFKVTMRFKKTYLQDEVREVQIDKIMTDTVEQRMALGLMTREDAADYLGIDPEDLPTEEEWDKLREKTMPKQGWGTSVTGQSKLNQHQLLSDSPEKMAQDKDKQGIALEKKSITRIKRLGNEEYEVEEYHEYAN